MSQFCHKNDEEIPASEIYAATLYRHTTGWGQFQLRRHRYSEVLTSTLYDKTLDANGGVLKHLTNLSEAEECKPIYTPPPLGTRQISKSPG